MAKNINIPNKNYWEKRSRARESAHFKNVQNLEKRLLKEYQKALKEVQKELSFFYAQNSQDFQVEKLKSLMKEIKKHINKLAKEEQLTIEDLLYNTTKENYYMTMYDIQKGIQLGYSFNMIDNKIIESIIKMPWSGANFSERIWNRTDKLIKVLKEELTQAFIRGSTVNAMANTLVDKFNVSFNNAKTLIRTEVNYVCNKSEMLAYKESEIDEYEFLATLDERTSTICQKLDGKVFKVKDAIAGVNIAPMHPKCRSTTIPHITDKTGERIAKRNNKKNYYVPADMTYEDWYNTYVNNEIAATKEEDSGIITVNEIFEAGEKVPAKYKPNVVVDVKANDNSINKRIFYGEDGYFIKQIHTTNHGNSKEHPYGIKGEHVHYYYWKNGKVVKKEVDEISEIDRKMNADILPKKGVVK